MEMMIVVLMISSLGLIAWPNISKLRKKSQQNLFEQKVKEAVENCRYYAMLNGKIVVVEVVDSEEKITTMTLDNLVFNGKIDKRFLINAQGDLYEE